MAMESKLVTREDALNTQILAARVIENCWCRFRDKQMFKLLKHAICTAEHSLTFEILRKVIPQEAELLRDPLFQARVRFAGSEFPPNIVFKIYMKSSGKGVKYFSGKKNIKPASEAASDSCKIMGNRRFFDQMMSDYLQHQQDGISDEIDVTNMKEYMKYLTNLDELPASMGGKDNTWRKLTLEVLPRHNIVYDIVNYMETGRSSPQLEENFSVFNSRLSTPAMQSEYLAYIAKNKKKSPSQGKATSGRQSVKARKRVAKMRKLYGLDKEENENKDVDFDSEDWDEEGQQLYEWTQELSFDTHLQPPYS